MAERTAIQSFDWRTLKVVQREAPDSPWTAGLHVRNFGGSIPRMVKAAGGAVWSPYYGEVSRENVKEAQALGLKVVVWTVNEPADMRRMIEFGVDGIISDYPDRLRQIAGEAGIALPRPTPVAP